MNKRELFYNAITGDDGNIQLPDEPSDAKRIASDYFGARLIGCLDSTTEYFISCLSGEVPTHHHRAKELSAELCSLSPEQRASVHSLLKESLDGLMFSVCSRLDQIGSFEVRIQLHKHGANGESDERNYIAVAGNSEQELHHKYFDWKDQFSEYFAGEADDTEGA